MIRSRSYILSVVCGVLGTLSFSPAQNQRTGTAAASEVLIPVGARDLAMGGSSIAASKGVEAVHWNPAGLGRLGSTAEGMFSTMSYIADIRVSYGAAAARFGEFGVLGLSLKTLDFGAIPLTTVEDPENRSGATFSPTFVTIGLTYARQITEAASVGATAKLISETFGRVSSTGIAFDLGIQYTGLMGSRGLQLGVAVKNIGPQMRYDGTGLLRNAISSDGNRPNQTYKSEAAGFELPSLIEIGLSYGGRIQDNMMYTVSSSYVNNNLYLDEYHVGGEYGLVMQGVSLFARAGYAFIPQVAERNDQIFGPTIGFGLAYRASGVDLSVDYAYRQVEFFDANNVLSVKVGF